MRGPVIIALDMDSQEQVMHFLDQFNNVDQLTVKVGMELFYREGPAIVRELKRRGCHIFLDLKLHDIPHTVERGMYQLAQLGADMVTVHALGGSAMITAAKKGLIAGSRSQQLPCPKLLAVTELTSISETSLRQEQNCRSSMTDQVVSLAGMAKRAGADGVITSPLEVASLRQRIGDDFLYVTPGIRLTQQNDDQTRVATPKAAARYGSSALVVGRPITQAKDPVLTYHKIMEEWQSAN